MESTITLIPRPPVDPWTREHHLDKAVLIRDEWRAQGRCMDCGDRHFTARALCNECRDSIRAGFIRVPDESKRLTQRRVTSNPFIFRRLA